MSRTKIFTIISVMCFVLFTIYRLAVPAVNINDALSEAIEQHDLQIMETLLKRGATPNIPVNRIGDRRDPIRKLISFYTGAYSIVESGGGFSIFAYVNEDELRLLAQYGDINKPMQGSRGSPLMHAIKLNRIENVRLLLKYGADYSATYSSQASILDLAPSDEMKQLLAPYKRKLKEKQSNPLK